MASALHDDLLRLVLTAAQDVEGARAGDPERLSSAPETLAAVAQWVRQASFDLRPHVLVQPGRRSALRAVAERNAERTGDLAKVGVVREVDGLDDELLFMLRREFLTNAAKHAGASEAELQIALAEERILMTMRDDGCGLAPQRRVEALEDGHIGLAAWEARVRERGGTMEVVSAKGRGTPTTVAPPLARAGWGESMRRGGRPGLPGGSGPAPASASLCSTTMERGSGCQRRRSRGARTRRRQPRPPRRGR